MPRLVIACVLLALAATRAFAIEPEVVTFPGRSATAPTVRALLYVPPGSDRRPAVVALHGCGGNYRSDGKTLIDRVPDWTGRFLAAGHVVLWPDSFGSRGLGSQCRVRERMVNPAARADDAVAAADWLATQPRVDASRIALVGWSNGGSTVLATIATARQGPGIDFKTAIAFYPGCRLHAERNGPDGKPWATRVPLTILIGAADDWTPPAPCRDLAQREAVRLVEYPGAYHDFDAPNAPVRVRTGLAFTADKSGRAHTGTDPAARAAAIAEVMQTLAAAFGR